MKDNQKKFVNRFEDACAKLGIDTEIPVFPERIREEYTNRYMLETIGEANGGGVGINGEYTDQPKYYPRFWITRKKGASGFGLSFHVHVSVYDATLASLGSRLVFLDPEAAIYMGKEVTPYYENLLNSKQ